MRARLLLFLGAVVLMSCRDAQTPPPRVTPSPEQEAELLSEVNPGKIRARVDVTDMRSTAGSVRVMASFSALSRLAGKIVPVRFNPDDAIVTCRVDAPGPPVTLTYRSGRYVGEVPRGPNYYVIEVRAAGRDYTVARVPVVQPLLIVSPPLDWSQRSDDDIHVLFSTSSWRALWSDDPRFQLEHENVGVVLERRADGTLRPVSRLTAPGDHTVDPQRLVLPMVRPFPMPGSIGTVVVVTRYRSRYLAPTDFMLEEWTSSAGAEVSFVWRKGN
jgi:hypothetical protein